MTLAKLYTKMQQATYFELKVIKKLFVILECLKVFLLETPASTAKSVNQLSAI